LLGSGDSAVFVAESLGSSAGKFLPNSSFFSAIFVAESLGSSAEESLPNSRHVFGDLRCRIAREFGRGELAELQARLRRSLLPNRRGVRWRKACRTPVHLSTGLTTEIAREFGREESAELQARLRRSLLPRSPGTYFLPDGYTSTTPGGGLPP